MRLSQQAWIDASVPAALEQGRAVEAGEPVDGVAVERLLQRGRELFDRYRAAQVDLQEALTRNRTDAMADQTHAITRTAGFTLVLALRSEEHTSELQSLMRTSYAVFCLKK